MTMSTFENAFGSFQGGILGVQNKGWIMILQIIFGFIIGSKTNPSPDYRFRTHMIQIVWMSLQTWIGTLP